MPNHIYHHYAPSVTLTHIISSAAPTYAPLDLWTDPTRVTALLVRWTEKLAVGPQVGTGPLARVIGVGRQQALSGLVEDLTYNRCQTNRPGCVQLLFSSCVSFKMHG